MSNLYTRDPMPTWRIVMYGVLAAVGVAALGYFLHDQTFYIFAVFSGVLFGGGGFLMSWLRSHAEPGQPVKTLRIPASSQMNMVRLIRILALPAALMGCLIFYDIFLAPAEQDVARITCKYLTHGKGGQNYIEARGHVLYHESVPLYFWDRCNTGDEIKLAITPRFKLWRDVSLMRNGELVAESMSLRDILGLGAFGACFFVPCIFFLPSLSETVPNHSSWQDNKFGVFCLFVEALALCFWAAILLGFS